LSDLALRALLIDSAGNTRFPANVVQEARAARALLQAGERGLDYLRRHVLVDLRREDGEEEPVRAVAPSWVNTLQLALPAGSRNWRDTVEAFDPLLCARATLDTADEAARHQAIWTLWNAYVDRRVWFDRSPSTGPDDVSPLLRLLAAGPPAGFADELRSGLASAEATLRANSLEALVRIEPRDAMLPLVSAALHDEHPVVRRKAAMAAFELAAVELVGEMAAQARNDSDELAGETLTDIAIALADNNTATEIAFASPERTFDRAMNELANKLPRLELLQLLLDREPFSQRLLEALLAISDRKAVRDSWTQAEVASLSRIVAEHADELRGAGGVDPVLARHPVSAIAARLCYPPDDWPDYEQRRLLAAADGEQLQQLASLLANPSAQALADLGVAAGAAADPETLAEAQAIVQSLLDQPAPPASVDGGDEAHVHRQRFGPDCETLVEAGDWATLIRACSADQALSRVPASAIETLRAQVTSQISTMITDRTLPNLLTAWTGHTPMPVWNPLSWAVRLDAPIEVDDWPFAAEYAARWQGTDVMQWVRRWWRPAAWSAFQARLAALSPGDLAAAAELIPPPWPDGFAELVRTSLSDLQLNDSRRKRVAALAYEGAGDAVVRSWSGDKPPDWLLPLLVQIGDCEAERRLLAGLVASPDLIPRWPLHYDTEWIRHVRCGESTPLMYTLLRAALISERGTNDLDPFFRALDRCAGRAVLPLYDRLIADPQIPGASFLFYRRRDALNQLADADVRPTSEQLPQLEAEIVALSVAAEIAG
jgi:hypothetical protein